MKEGLGLFTMAGIANFFSCAYLKRARTSSPTMTPVFRERTSCAPMFAMDSVSGKKVSVLFPQVFCVFASSGAGRDVVVSIRNWLKGSEGHVTDLLNG